MQAAVSAGRVERGRIGQKGWKRREGEKRVERGGEGQQKKAERRLAGHNEVK